MSIQSGISGVDLEVLYQNRFTQRERQRKEAIWRVLCRHFFQRWVPRDATVLEIASGYGEFIRNIRAARKLAVDLNPEAGRVLGPEIEFHQSSATQLSSVPSGSVDIVFSSNFFEHLRSKSEMDAVLAEAHRVLKGGGLYLSLQPNLKYVGQDYWDFYDHELPLTHLSATEAFERHQFRVEYLQPRFLPYTTKSRLPQAPWLVRAYLCFPFAWRFLGKQFFLVARKA
jgi:ubiquinone/menaquinone biosynthesis C-methylase UbiE